jgi:hypothetical protein
MMVTKALCKLWLLEVDFEVLCFRVDFERKRYGENEESGPVQTIEDMDKVEYLLGRLPKSLFSKSFSYEEKQCYAKGLQKIEELEKLHLRFDRNDMEDAGDSEDQPIEISEEERAKWNAMAMQEILKHVKEESLQNPDSMTRVERKIVDDVWSHYLLLPDQLIICSKQTLFEYDSACRKFHQVRDKMKVRSQVPNHRTQVSNEDLLAFNSILQRERQFS